MLDARFFFTDFLLLLRYMKVKLFLSLLLILLTISSVVHSEEEGFIVQDIKVTGLQRISVGTVFNYLPVNIGEKLLNKNIAPAIRAVFKTGFFQVCLDGA